VQGRFDLITKWVEELSEQIDILYESVVGNGSSALTDCLVTYHTVKDAEDALSESIKGISRFLDKANKKQLPEMFEKDGSDHKKIPAIGRSFYVLNKHSGTVLDKPRAFDWLRGRGAGDLIQETVNAGTLTNYLVDMVTKDGIDPPDDLFKLSGYKIIGSSKYNPKGDKSGL
jgi:hypothetical protein